MVKNKYILQLDALNKRSNNFRLAAEGWGEDWKTLLSIVLSARTRDEKTIEVANSLFAKYPTLLDLSKSKLRDLERIIRPINFYRNKAKNILNCCKILYLDYGGEVPRNFEELIKLPGVGRKTANVFLAEIGRDHIGVDTHVFYISRYLGWSKSNTPINVEKDLKDLFPKDMWREINPILVRFGKTYISRTKKNKILDEIMRI